jgi:sulfur carrier protein|tara:strand:- start:187 stop:384 length:198 start_codon:yes stop_codon:yes gene_type:complete
VNIIVNGQNRNIINVNLTFALDELGYKKMKLATALNGEFVSVQARDNLNLKEGDKLEVLSPQQGG